MASLPAVRLRALLLASVSAFAGPISANADDPLLGRIQELCDSWSRRPLDPERHDAWLLFHALMALGDDALVSVGRDPELPGGTSVRAVSAMSWLLDGGQVRGLGMAVGSEGAVSFGVRRGVAGAQEHVDQWLGCLLINVGISGGVKCSVRPGTSGVLRSKAGVSSYKIGDLIANSWRRAVPEQELAWSIIAFTAFTQEDVARTRAGREPFDFSVEDMVAIEAGRDRSEKACGGSHSLIGQAIALERHERALRSRGVFEGLVGGWAKARDAVDEEVLFLRQLQQSDGSFIGRSLGADVSEKEAKMVLRTSGHAMQVLAIALRAEELSEPWVRNGARYLCALLERLDGLPPSGNKYHALHGLAVYRAKVLLQSPDTRNVTRRLLPTNE